MQIPAKAFAQHTIVLAKTRSGKSSAIRGLIVEPILDAGKRVCVIDPKGDWWGLKSSASGKRAGYPIVIFGGYHADVPINAHAGGYVAELVATGNRPCVIDFGQFTVADRTRFFMDFAQTLFRLIRSPLTLVIDECHNFAPQGKVYDPESGKMLHWANKIASEGGGKGITLISASQRPQKVHKDYVTCHETLIAMRAIHPLDRGAIRDWVEGCDNPDMGKEVLKSLAGLDRGEGFIWAPDIKFGPVRMKFPMFKTYDSFAAPTGEPVELKGWASVDLDEVKAKLSTIVAEAEANDPRKLKARIAELEAAARKAATLATNLSNTPAKPDAKALATEFSRGQVDGYALGFKAAAASAVAIVDNLRPKAVEAIEIRYADVAGRIAGMKPPAHKIVGVDGRSIAPLPAVKAGPVTLEGRTLFRGGAPLLAGDIKTGSIVRVDVGGNGEALKPSVQRVIDAVAWWAKIGQVPADRDRACVVAGLSPKASTFGVYVAEAVKLGLIITGKGTLALTLAGSAKANVPEATTEAELRAIVQGMLTTQERKVFDVVWEAYPRSIARDDVAAALGLSPAASTTGVYIAGVAAYGAIAPAERGTVRAADWLFPDATRFAA